MGNQIYFVTFAIIFKKLLRKLQARDIYDAFFPLHLMSKYICITPLFQNNSDNIVHTSLKVTIPPTFTSATLLLCFIISVFMLIFNTREIPQKYLSDVIILVTTTMQIGSGCISVGTVIWMRMMQKKCVNTWYQVAQKMDYDLEQTNIYVNNNLLKLLVNFLVIIGNVTIFGTLFLHFRRLYIETKKVYLFMIISIAYPFILLNIHTFRYISSSLLLYKRFKLLNDHLKDILVKYKFQKEELTINFSTMKHKLDELLRNQIILHEQRIVLVGIHGVTDTVTMIMIFILKVFNLYYLCAMYIIPNNTELYNQTAIIWWLLYSQIIIFLVLWNSKRFTKEVSIP